MSQSTPIKYTVCIAPHGTSSAQYGLRPSYGGTPTDQTPPWSASLPASSGWRCELPAWCWRAVFVAA